MTMGEIADTIRMFLACAVQVCAAAGGVVLAGGAVWSVTGNAFGATGIGFVPVGASNVFPDNEQVYTK